MPAVKPPVFAASELTLMMRPQPTRLHARYHLLRPVHRAVQVGRHARGATRRREVASILLLDSTPALFTSISTGPSAATTSACAAATANGIADVAADTGHLVAEAFLDGPQRFALQVDQRDTAAERDQRLGRGTAHRAASAGDQRDLALQAGKVHASNTLFLPNRPRARKVTTAMNSRYIDTSDHSEA